MLLGELFIVGISPPKDLFILLLKSTYFQETDLFYRFYHSQL